MEKSPNTISKAKLKPASCQHPPTPQNNPRTYNKEAKDLRYVERPAVCGRPTCKKSPKTQREQTSPQKGKAEAIQKKATTTCYEKLPQADLEKTYEKT